MKKTIALLIFACSTFSVSAQRHYHHRNWGSQLKVGAGNTTMSQDFKTKNFFAEYEHQVSRHLSIAPSLTYNFTDGNRGWDWHDTHHGDNIQPEAVTADLNVLVSPVRTRRTALKVGLGFSRRFDADPTAAPENAFDNTEWENGTRGRNLIFAADRRLGNLVIGVRHNIQKYKDHERFSNWNVGIGFRL